MLFSAVVRWSLRNRVLVLALSIVLLALGLGMAQRLSVDVLPDLTRPTVTVNTEATGLAPEDVEALMTVPVEIALSGLPGVARVRSVSSPSLSLVYAEFDWNTEPYLNRQLVAERLEAVRPQLPPGVQPRIGPLTSLMGEVLLIALQADAEVVDAMTLRDLGEWSLRPSLLSVPGVAQIVVIGGEVRQYEIRPDPERMRLFGVTLTQIEQAAQGFGRDLGGGFVDVGGQEITVRARGRPFQASELRELAVAWRDGAAIRLGQVADLGEGARLKRGDAGADGGPAVILAIQKQPGVDTVALTQQLEQRLATLDAVLPGGVTRTTLFRQADFIAQSVGNVREALLHGALIVALVLFAFLASGRATLVTLTAIPLSVLAAILVLRAFELSINTMTLGGIAIAVGELVDDAVVGVENVVRRLRRRAPDARESIAQIIAAATVEVRSAILYATLIIVLVFLPLFALGGVEGRLFAPLGVAYIAAILASLVVAVTVTPVLCRYAFATAAVLSPERRWLLALKARYLQLLARTLARPRLLYALAVLMVVVAAVAALQLPRAFLPAFNEGTLTVNLILKPGISLAESDRLGAIAERLLLAVPEVVHVGRRTGRAELDEHAEGVHYSELDVSLRDSERDRLAIVADVRARLAPLPGTLAIGQPISHRLDHLLSGVRAPLVVKIVGDDLNTLRQLGEQVRARLAGIDGLADVQVEQQVDVPQSHVRIDARGAAQYGVSAVRAQEALSRMLVGSPLSQLVEGERRYDLVLRLPEALRTPAGFDRLLMDAPAGPIPLSWIAGIDAGTGPNQVLREHLRRRLVVSAFPATRGFEQGSREAQAAVAALRLPPGYQAQVEGQVLAGAEAGARILWLGLASLLLMAAVLYGRYRSPMLTLIILGNVPLALVGGVLALALTSTPLSVASLVGFITLAGIVVRNDILKISHYLNLSRQEQLPFGPALVLRGSGERLTPVLMTALIAALALLPLLLSGGEPGKEILHPVALVIFGGLVSSTLLDSFLTPALFLRFGRPAVEALQRDSYFYDDL